MNSNLFPVFTHKKKTGLMIGGTMETLLGTTKRSEARTYLRKGK